MYLYQSFEPGLYTVGFYDPAGRWITESGHSASKAAAARTHWLNGLSPQIAAAIDKLTDSAQQVLSNVVDPYPERATDEETGQPYPDILQLRSALDHMRKLLDATQMLNVQFSGARMSADPFRRGLS